jgi:hypothetical protein
MMRVRRSMGMSLASKRFVRNSRTNPTTLLVTSLITSRSVPIVGRLLRMPSSVVGKIGHLARLLRPV